MAGASHDGGKHSARCVIPGEPSLHQAGAVVTHQGGGLFVVAHGVSSETRAHARRQAALVQVMTFPLCFEWLMGGIGLSQHARARLLWTNNVKKSG